MVSFIPNKCSISYSTHSLFPWLPIPVQFHFLTSFPLQMSKPSHSSFFNRLNVMLDNHLSSITSMLCWTIIFLLSLQCYVGQSSFFYLINVMLDNHNFLTSFPLPMSKPSQSSSFCLLNVVLDNHLSSITSMLCWTIIVSQSSGF